MTAKAASPGPRAVPSTASGDAAAHRAGPDGGRQTLHRAAGGGVDGGGDADFVDGGLQRGNLRGELSGGLAVVLVLDRQPGVGRGEIVERGRALQRAPSPIRIGSASAIAMVVTVGPEREGEPADDPARSIGDDNRISSGRHGSPRPPPPGAAQFGFVKQETLPRGQRTGK